MLLLFVFNFDFIVSVKYVLNRVLESFETIVYGCAIVFRIENRVMPE